MELTYTPLEAPSLPAGDVDYGLYLDRGPTAIPRRNNGACDRGGRSAWMGEILFRGGYGLDGFYLVDGEAPSRIDWK